MESTFICPAGASIVSDVLANKILVNIEYFDNAGQLSLLNPTTVFTGDDAMNITMTPNGKFL